MKRIILLTALLSVSLFLQAQYPAQSSVVGRITGTILDSAGAGAIEYATVSLKVAGAQKNTNGALTDNKGQFHIDNVKPGRYVLSLSFMGYKTKTLNIATTGAKPDLALGKILISASANQLSAVSVTADVPMIEARVDKTVYNAEKDPTVAGGSASDVLRKVPMVSVDQDGNISLRGNSNVRILINGKPTGAVSANVAEAMKMIPADQIKNVEVITSPSAKYDAEGSGGIINIITKKKEMSGVSGSIGGGIGTRQNNGNGNININKNRLSITANFGGHGGWPQTTQSYYRSEDPSRQSLLLQQGESRTSRIGYMSSANVSYDINDFNSISTGIRYNRGNFKTDGLSQNSRSLAGVTEAYTLDNYNKSKMSGIDWNADYTHKFNDKGKELSLAGQWSHSKNETDLYTLYSLNSYTDLKGNNKASNDEYTVQADYTHPFSKAIKLELGAKGIFRDISSPSEFYTSVNGGDFVFSDSRSSVYDYHQDVYAGYTVLNLQLSKTVGLQAGGRIEQTEINGSSQNNASGIAAVKNSYTNFIPSFAISKNFGPLKSVRLSYSKRIQRPSLQYLNPFRDVSNDQAQRQGNPLLDPEISQTVELNYSWMPAPGSMINSSVYFRHTSDIIEGFARPDTYDGKEVILTTFNNTGNNNSVGASLFGSVNIKKIFTLRGNFDVFTYSPSANASFQNLTGDTKTYAMYKGFLSGSANLAKNLVAETFMILNSPRRTIQGKNPSFNMWVISVNKQFWNKKAKLGINIVDPFNENKHFRSNINTGSLVQVSDFAIPFRSFGLNFSYSFGKINMNAQPKKKRGVNNNDLKEGDSGQGMGGGIGN